MGRPKSTANLFKPDVPVNKHNPTASGTAGFDNVRENIDPHIRTGAVSTSEGTIQGTPTNHKDIVNKEYVDAVAGGGLILFLTENASDIATYFDIQPIPSTDPEENIVTAVTGTAGTLMASFASILNCPCTSNLIEMSEGVYTLHLHAKGELTNKMTFYFEIYKRTAGGVETLLMTSEDSNLLSAVSASYVVHATLAVGVDWDSTDRVVVKVYGKNVLAVAKDLTIYMEGSTASRVTLAGNIPSGNNVTATNILTNETLVQGDGGLRGVKTSTITIAEMEVLTDNSMANALHRHSELSASDGTPDAAFSLNAAGEILYTNGTDSFDIAITTNRLWIQTNTTDGSDDQRITLDAGSGADSDNRGASLTLSGNEATNPGDIINQLGEAGDFKIHYGTSGDLGFVFDPSGNLSIGGAVPIANLHVQKADAGAVDPNVGADQLCLEGTDANGVGMSILSPDNVSARIAFGSPTGTNLAATILYRQNINLLNIAAAQNANSKITMTTGASAAVEISNNIYIASNCSALTFTDRP